MLVWSEDHKERQHGIAEVVRAAAFRLFNIQLDPKDRYQDVRDFWPFSWDAPKEDGLKRLAEMTVEEKKKSLETLLSKVNW